MPKVKKMVAKEAAPKVTVDKKKKPVPCDWCGKKGLETDFAFCCKECEEAYFATNK